MAYIRKRVGEEAVAKDILQEVLLKIQVKLPQLRDHAKLFPWLQTIARNSITDHFRSRKKLSQVPLLDIDVDQLLADEDQKSDLLHTCLPTFIQALPEKYREALYLVEIEGYTQKELAEHLDISYSGAKSRVQRGRERLKAIILECCHVTTDVYGNVLGYEKNKGC